MEVLLNPYGVPERVPFFRDLIRTAKRGEDWWIGFTDAVPEWFELHLGPESAAARISSYDAQLVPGLFQTRAYADAVYRAGERRFTDEQIVAEVEVRTGRQAVLDREDDPPHVWCVLDEGALRRVVGGPDVMRAQLDHLLALAERPTVDLQVLGAASGAHAGVEGTFPILEYPAEFGGDPGTAYVETRQQGVYYEPRSEGTSNEPVRMVHVVLQRGRERLRRGGPRRPGGGGARHQGPRRGSGVDGRSGAVAAFVAEVAGGRPYTNGALAVTERAEVRHHPGRGEVRTRWHLRCPADGAELHFDDREWEAFRRGAVDGEFAPPRTPAAAP